MRLIIMFIAIALAAGAFFITAHFTTSPSEKGVPIATPMVKIQEVPTDNIYIAKQDIPIGASVEQKMLDIQPWPRHLKLPDMIDADPNQPNQIVKMVARTPFQKGEPIIMTKLANDKDPSFLAASIGKGMRVVTIGVDSISGVGGFVFPGDRVDVLITHDVSLGKTETIAASAPSGPAGNSLDATGKGVAGTMNTASSAKSVVAKKDPVTEVLLSNIRVLAINQKSTAHGGEPPVVPSNVSLEVSAADAQKLRLTESSNGRLSLALRSLKDKDTTELARPTGVSDLSRLTPPSYFPVLFDNNGQANFVSPAAEAAYDEPESSSITVVRGVKAEDVEVSRP